jgi:dihydroorotate dehydrogenase electron transfer subunit
VKFHDVQVTGREEVGRYTVLRYRWDGPSIAPGQFVMARAATYPISFDPFLARPLSVYDYEAGVASVLFEVRGRGTALLDRASDTLQVSGPLGRGFRVDPAAGPAALLGGGIGIAPMKILSRKLLGSDVPHDVFLGFSDADTARAATAFPGATVATMDGSVGVAGTVLDAIPGLDSYGAVYACGPNPMLAAVKRAVGEHKLCQLSVEERMGCGNGSCNGCVVPVRDRGYVRSCVEGPVFEAEALAW